MPWTRINVTDFGDAADKLAEFLTRPKRADDPVANGANTGNGVVFGASSAIDSVDETWTLVCTTGGGSGVGIFSVTGSVSGAQADATVDEPYWNGLCSFTIIGGTVDFTTGTPDDFTFDIAADTPTWVQQRGYKSDERISSIQPGSVSDPGAGNTGNGSLTGVLTIDGVVAETWTITATTTGPTATFSVVGSVSGGHAAATSGTPYNNGLVSFSISDGGVAYIIGDDFTFDTERTVDTVIVDAGNTGNGTVGTMSGVASDRPEGETITLTATSATNFDVDGSLTGDFGSDATVGIPYDNGEFILTITAGGTPFVSGDKFTFQTRPFEYILKGIGGGSDEIFVGYKEETNGSTYYNWSLQGFTGYVSASTFENQPGYESGIWNVQTDGGFDILIIENARRFIVIPIIGSTYAHIYLGWILPTATPSQWDYPLFKGGDSNDDDTLIGDTANHFAWWTGPPYGDMYNNAVWDSNSDIWPYDLYTIHKTEDDEFPLFPVTVVNKTTNEKTIYGEADGCFYVDGDGGAVTVSDSVIAGSELFFITQDINRVGDDNLMALRLE